MKQKMRIVSSVSPNAQRQREYKARQEALGRKKRPLWLTDDEFQEVKHCIEHMRAVTAPESLVLAVLPEKWGKPAAEAVSAVQLRSRWAVRTVYRAWRGVLGGAK